MPVKIDALLRGGLGEAPAEAAAAQVNGYDGVHSSEVARVRARAAGDLAVVAARRQARLRRRVLPPHADDADVQPGAAPSGPPRVLIAAVGDAMTQVAGEVADGLIAHGFTTDATCRK